ncbi:MAG: DEAD/DEAH box helicase, partial [Candidatus Sumerlaeia bacterium]|nr:DEAD/DEAH box helicase [Candidatus Sumerlaeia bacterium]
MSVEQLIAYKIPVPIISRWREQGVTELLPLQELAMTETAYLRGGNLVVFAPTSSGKTFIGESAAVKVLNEQRRVVYLVPTKALAEEKFRYFSDLLSPLGFKLIIATSERQEADEKVATGKFDLLIAVYEKMKSYLVRHPQLLAQLGLVIIDELQMLGDASRGDVLDIILSKIKVSPYKPQLIGLSATLSEAHKIAEWLEAELLNFHRRPVELREGVYNQEDGIFYYRCFNSGIEGSEPLTLPLKLPDNENTIDAYIHVLKYLIQQLAENKNEQVLIFVPTKHWTRQLAVSLARQSSLSEATTLLDEIRQYEESYSREVLLSTLQHSIAFHNADLSWDLRELIEDYYDRGIIRVLFSTTTLGQGVNLTGRNVINVHEMVASDEWSGEYSFVPLSRQRFYNQGGRSARYARSEEFGRSILIAMNRAEAERLLKYYVGGELEPIDPPLINKPLDKYVVDLVATGVYNTRQKIQDFFLTTYTGYRQWRGGESQQKIMPAIESAINRMLELKFLRENEADELLISGAAEVVAINGINPLTALRFKKWIEQVIQQNALPDVIEVLLTVSFTPDAFEFPVGLSYAERTSTRYVEELRRRLLERGLPADTINRLIIPASGLSRNDITALKKTLILSDWLSPANATPDIERRYQVLAGTIQHLGLHYNWLLQALAQVAVASAGGEVLIKYLNSLAERLIYGVDEAGLALARLRVSGLSRAYIFNLLREGFDTPATIASVTDKQILMRILPERLAEKLIIAVQEFPGGTKIPADGLSEPKKKAGRIPPKKRKKAP